jgi:hypothetical protein
MAGLKPNEEVMAATAAVAAVLTIFSFEAPDYADVRAAQPHNAMVHKSVKGAAITSAAVVAGLALLAKSPTVYVAGGVTTAYLAWKGYRLNATEPVSGKVTVPYTG